MLRRPRQLELAVFRRTYQHARPLALLRGSSCHGDFVIPQYFLIGGLLGDHSAVPLVKDDKLGCFGPSRSLPRLLLDQVVLV